MFFFFCCFFFVEKYEKIQYFSVEKNVPHLELWYSASYIKGGGGWGAGGWSRGWGMQPTSYKIVKEIVDFCEKGSFKSIRRFIIIFVVLMRIRISSENVPRMKVFIFADLMYYSIVIIENTQAQYILIALYTSALKNDNTVMH